LTAGPAGDEQRKEEPDKPHQGRACLLAPLLIALAANAFPIAATFSSMGEAVAAPSKRRVLNGLVQPDADVEVPLRHWSEDRADGCVSNQLSLLRQGMHAQGVQSARITHNRDHCKPT
jgi:hypothetical protein